MHEDRRVGVNVSLPLGLIDLLEQVAKDRHTTRSALVEEALEAWLNAWPEIKAIRESTKS